MVCWLDEMSNSDLYKRLFDICYKHKLHHLGSYFSSLEIIDSVHGKMSDDDIFILSCGHAAVSLYVVLEKYYGFDAEAILLDHGEHPKLDEARHIYCSTGSLGMGLPVAVGMATASPSKKIYCLLSDGECFEGSIWESLQFVQNHDVSNLEIHVNANGYSAYDTVDLDYLERRLISFCPGIHFHRTTVEHLPFLKNIDAHYYSMKPDDLIYREKL